MAGRSLPLVVALHARGGDAPAAIAQARRTFGGAADVVALQGARPCNPLQSNGTAPAYAGFSWYLGDDPLRPEPASFGDALAQVEAFVSSLAEPFVLLGHEQGAVLALTLALYAPALLAGVAATSGGIASIDGWTPPAPSLEGTAVMLDEEASLDRCGILATRGAACTVVGEDGGAKWLQDLTAGFDPRGDA